MAANLNFLHPWVKARAKYLIDWGTRNLIDPYVTSARRTFDEQKDLWDMCQAKVGRRGFPVKDPGCSQHLYGFAFDMQAQVKRIEAPQVQGPFHLACYLYPDLWFCPGAGDPLPANVQTNAQRLLCEEARRVGMICSATDAVHFQTFETKPWNAHMRRYFGASCETCHYPEGPPY